MENMMFTDNDDNPELSPRYYGKYPGVVLENTYEDARHCTAALVSNAFASVGLAIRGSPVPKPIYII